MAGIAKYKYSKRLLVVVPAGDTLDVHTTPLADFRKLIYEIEAFNTSEDKSKSLNMRATRHDGTVSDSVYGIIGSILNFELSFLKVGTDGVLEVKNNEAFALTLSIIVSF